VLHCIQKFVKITYFTENILALNLGWQKEKYFIEVSDGTQEDIDSEQMIRISPENQAF
jgi:hypothetical protein